MTLDLRSHLDRFVTFADLSSAVHDYVIADEDLRHEVVVVLIGLVVHRIDLSFECETFTDDTDVVGLQIDLSLFSSLHLTDSEESTFFSNARSNRCKSVHHCVDRWVLQLVREPEEVGVRKISDLRILVLPERNDASFDIFDLLGSVSGKLTTTMTNFFSLRTDVVHDAAFISDAFTETICICDRLGLGSLEIIREVSHVGVTIERIAFCPAMDAESEKNVLPTSSDVDVEEGLRMFLGHFEVSVVCLLRGS
ncbi:hypothetical protein AU106_gp210 [Sinorhizobium phage phiM9]|uniref:Uncharacterized protein n=1 Tax=Sinorhizobium phage phiM9 TaxID=1636182 RepID=A0A0F6TH77_9CAUD|nr:hypothetical protein AU106_gp210 [Sinorhizobium phage phiM9]AKE44841.1 hypothetical protein Sm_phiM9_214 [Sinorhizobium phage phiM9]